MLYLDKIVELWPVHLTVLWKLFCQFIDIVKYNIFGKAQVKLDEAILFSLWFSKSQHWDFLFEAVKTRTWVQNLETPALFSLTSSTKIPNFRIKILITLSRRIFTVRLRFLILFKPLFSMAYFNTMCGTAELTLTVLVGL